MSARTSLDPLRMLRFGLMFLALGGALSAQVPIGATKDEVIGKLGWPTSTSSAGSRELLSYPQYTVLLEDGRVTKLQPKPNEGRPKLNPPAPPALPPAQTLKLSASPRASKPVPPPVVASPSPALVRPAAHLATSTRPMPRGTDSTGSVFGRLFFLALLGGLALAIKLWSLRLKSRQGSGTDRYLGPLPPKSPVAEQSTSAGVIWSLDLLKDLEWHRFEEVVAEFYRTKGRPAELTQFGADGGIDVVVCAPGTTQPDLLVQCKAWDNAPVQVQTVRELYGVAAAHKLSRTAFFTTSSFTPDARAFAQSVEMDLVDGVTFLERIRQLPAVKQMQLLSFAVAGDYLTPTCPTCGIKMVLRTASTGRSAGESFWGCTNFPRGCRSQLAVTRVRTSVSA